MKWRDCKENFKFKGEFKGRMWRNSKVASENSKEMMIKKKPVLFLEYCKFMAKFLYFVTPILVDSFGLRL